ncbi:MAG TPA: hypothetical protein VHK26_08415 [Methyloceanibacter sp.]|jgi:hypothetical protein|nr:hypothetical protein [Methyloceanibacter sp.]
MPLFTVQQGKRYRATITLGLLQSVASNEAVAEKFQDVGFTEVEVTGSGRTREGRGLWPHSDASAEVPPEITSVEEIEA